MRTLLLAILGLLVWATPSEGAWSRVQRVTCTTTVAAASYVCNTASTGANHLLVVSLWANVFGINTPTDNLSTTYQLDFDHADLQRTYSAVVASGVTTVTLNLAGAGNSSAIVEEWSGNITSSWFDVTASNIGQVAAAWTSTATVTLNQTGELAIGFCYDSANATDTNTPSGGFGDGGVSRNSTDGDSLFTENQVLASTTGIAATGTLSATHTLDNWVVTYKPSGVSVAPTMGPRVM